MATIVYPVVFKIAAHTIRRNKIKQNKIESSQTYENNTEIQTR